jgi:hypothetical protein
MSPEELVRYTFSALESWGLEHGHPRGAYITPLEFSRQIAAVYPELGPSAQLAANLYSMLAYAGGRVPKEPTPQLAELWQAMRTNLPGRTPVAAEL